MGADWYAPGCWDGLVDDLDRADWNEANDETRGYVVRTVANRGARASGPRQPVYAYEHAAVIIIRDILDRIVAEFKARADLDTGGDR